MRVMASFGPRLLLLFISYYYGLHTGYGLIFSGDKNIKFIIKIII